MKETHFFLVIIIILTVLILGVGCDSAYQYDVRGIWLITGKYADIDFIKTLDFRGDKTQGTVTDEIAGIASYSSDGYTVEFDLSIICFCNKTWKGYFVDANHMGGTVTGCSSGTWTASRIE